MRFDDALNLVNAHNSNKSKKEQKKHSLSRSDTYKFECFSCQSADFSTENLKMHQGKIDAYDFKHTDFLSFFVTILLQYYKIQNFSTFHLIRIKFGNIQMKNSLFDSNSL